MERIKLDCGGLCRRLVLHWLRVKLWGRDWLEQLNVIVIVTSSCCEILTTYNESASSDETSTLQAR